MCYQSLNYNFSFGFFPIALSVVAAFAGAHSVYVEADSCHSVIPTDHRIRLSLLICCFDHKSVLISLRRRFGHNLDLLDLFYGFLSFSELH